MVIVNTASSGIRALASSYSLHHIRLRRSSLNVAQGHQRPFESLWWVEAEDSVTERHISNQILQLLIA